MSCLWLHAVLSCTAIFVFTHDAAEAGPSQSKIPVDQILREVPLIDGHNDLAEQLHDRFRNQLERIDLNQSLIGIVQTDIPRLRQGQVGAQFWSAYAGCSSQYKDAVRACLDQVDVIRRFVAKYPETFKLVTTADGITEAFSAGLIGSLIGVEGGHCIDSSLAALRMLYELGTRYLTLTHNCDTPWADSQSASDTSGPADLSDFGVTVIQEMNRLGMIVDLAHVSAATMRRVLNVSQAPVIYSHSGAYTLCPHNRNVPDDVLLTTRDKGGLVMVDFYPPFVTCSDVATVSDVANHFDYIKNLIGVDYVGVGGDFDGIELVPVGLEDVSTYPVLFQELQNRGWTDAELKKVAGENMIRVFKAVEQVSLNLQQTFSPLENLIPAADLTNKTACRSLVP